MSMTAEDLRAAVAAGVLTEAQAASVSALAQSRARQRNSMPAEDEPFEFFRGFSEVFVSIGLVILLSGIVLMLGWFGGAALTTSLPLICAGIAWWWAGYFTLKRRMNLPSMVLAVAFGSGIYLSVHASLTLSDLPQRSVIVSAFLLAALGMVLWYRRFRLPFAAFLVGLSLLGAIYTLTASLASLAGFMNGGEASIAGFFDLRDSPQFAFATLAFGVGCFLAGMWFDTRDPYRLGRHAATAFWLHLLAAPALVNTVALTLYNTGGVQGIGLLVLALMAITALALIIDRRSFLSAAIAYIALVIAWILQADGKGSLGTWTFILIALGGLITAIGTWWVPLRSGLMRALPDFPGKSRLPPYGL